MRGARITTHESNAFGAMLAGTIVARLNGVDFETLVGPI